MKARRLIHEDATASERGAELGSLATAERVHVARVFLEQRALLMDPDRLVERVIALHASEREASERGLGIELDEYLPRAVGALLVEDQRHVLGRLLEASPGRSEGPRGSTDDGYLEQLLGLLPERAQLAAVRFNRLPDAARVAFFVLKQHGQVPTPEQVAGRLAELGAPWSATGEGANGAESVDSDTIKELLQSGLRALLDRGEHS